MNIQYCRPPLYPKQQAAIFHNKRYGFIEASTKAGKTVGNMAWLLEKSLIGAKPNQNRWWVAPVYGQAEIAYTRMKHGLPKNIFDAHDTKLRLAFINGANIWFKSGEKPDNLYGDDVYDVVIDEASRLREEAYTAIRTTLTATRGSLRAIGNVKGRKNWFYRLCRKAQAGDPNMEYHKLTAYDAVEGGVLAAEEIEAARQELPENIFRELYLAEPSDDGGNPFGITAIQGCIKALSNLEPVCWAWDLAKSYDWTVGIGLDKNGDVCRFERFQKSWQDTISYIRAVTGKLPALVDSTGVGDPVLEALQANGGTNFEGFKFSQASKQQLMEGLAVAIQQKQVGYPVGAIVSELEQFEYEYTRTGVRYSAPEGFHDDCVCALALAVRKKTLPVAGAGWLGFVESQAAEAQKSTEKTKQP